MLEKIQERAVNMVVDQHAEDYHGNLLKSNLATLEDKRTRGDMI